MQSLHGISRWIDTVVGVIVVWSRHFAAPRLVKLSEDESGNLIFQPPADSTDTSSKSESFRLNQGKGVEELSSALSAILVGSRVELTLQPTRFIFRPIDLPQGAAEFLHGIVQTQIDRLTPWNAANAAFGWSAPTEDGSRLVVNIAATAKSLISDMSKPSRKLVRAPSRSLLCRPLHRLALFRSRFGMKKADMDLTRSMSAVALSASWW